MGKMQEIVSIDIGSTNSQMAVKYVDMDNNQPFGWYDTLTENLITDGEFNKNIPTILLEWLGQGSRPVTWTRDVPAGNSVFELVRGSFQDEIKVIREFKKDLFYTQDEKDKDPQKAKKYEEACESTKKFLRYLKDVKDRNNKTGIVVPEDFKTYITVPVRSKNDDFTFIRQIAEEAGWKNIEILDEAKAALDFAVYKPDSELMKAIEKLTVHNKIYVLLVDIGGSTTDLLLAEISPDGKGKYESHYKAQWPPTGTTDTLGCIDIDKKVADLLKKSGYLIDYLVEEEINSRGYKIFSDFKEKWSEAAKTDNIISDYTIDLKGLASDVSNFKFAEVIYNRLPDSEKLGKKEFEEIISEYIVKLQNAIRSVLNHVNIAEQDLDYVVLTGGGSEMYGIEEMILGKLNVENPLNFTKIKNNPSACIHGCVENPSAACCLGNLLEKTNIKCTNHINGTYTATVEVYTADASVIANYSGLKDKKKNGKPSLPEKSFYQTSYSFELTDDLAALPISGKDTFVKSVNINSGDNFIFRISVYKQNNVEEKKNIECSWLYRSERTLTQSLLDGAHKLFGVGKDRRRVNLYNEIQYSISENRRIKIKPSYKADGFCTNFESTKEMEL